MGTFALLEPVTEELLIELLHRECDPECYTWLLDGHSMPFVYLLFLFSQGRRFPSGEYL